LRIIFGLRVFVSDQDRDRRAERFACKHAGKNFATIFFSPLRRDFTLTWATAVQLSLNLSVGDVDLRRATVDYDTDAATV
jgi:hypothetical protein